jgi:hypothetical protein
MNAVLFVAEIIVNLTLGIDISHVAFRWHQISVNIHNYPCLTKTLIHELTRPLSRSMCPAVALYICIHEVLAVTPYNFQICSVPHWSQESLVSNIFHFLFDSQPSNSRYEDQNIESIVKKIIKEIRKNGGKEAEYNEVLQTVIIRII